MMGQFSIDNYMAIIQAFENEGYVILPLGHAVPEGYDGKVALLYHDVDFHPVYAAEMARANLHLRVKGTFLYRLACPIYNVYAEKCWIREVSEFEQIVGIHIDNFEDPELLKAMLAPVGVAVANVFSHHNPDFDSHQDMVKADYRDWTNPMALPAKGWLYYSDSNHEYQKSVEEWMEVARAPGDRKLLNFHPFQWYFDGDSMEWILSMMWGDIQKRVEVEFATNKIWREKCRPKS